MSVEASMALHLAKIITRMCHDFDDVKKCLQRIAFNLRGEITDMLNEKLQETFDTTYISWDYVNDYIENSQDFDEDVSVIIYSIDGNRALCDVSHGSKCYYWIDENDTDNIDQHHPNSTAYLKTTKRSIRDVQSILENLSDDIGLEIALNITIVSSKNN